MNMIYHQIEILLRLMKINLISNRSIKIHNYSFFQIKILFLFVKYNGELFL